MKFGSAFLVQHHPKWFSGPEHGAHFFFLPATRTPKPRTLRNTKNRPYAWGWSTPDYLGFRELCEARTGLWNTGLWIELMNPCSHVTICMAVWVITGDLWMNSHKKVTTFDNFCILSTNWLLQTSSYPLLFTFNKSNNINSIQHVDLDQTRPVR